MSIIRSATAPSGVKRIHSVTKRLIIIQAIPVNPGGTCRNKMILIIRHEIKQCLALLVKHSVQGVDLHFRSKGNLIRRLRLLCENSHGINPHTVRTATDKRRLAQVRQWTVRQ